jgi:hypothetical protein
MDDPVSEDMPIERRAGRPKKRVIGQCKRDECKRGDPIWSPDEPRDPRSSEQGVPGQRKGQQKDQIGGDPMEPRDAGRPPIGAERLMDHDQPMRLAAKKHGG